MTATTDQGRKTGQDRDCHSQDDRAAEAAPKKHEKGQKRQDSLLDEGVEETFPASDPVSVHQIT